MLKEMSKEYNRLVAKAEEFLKLHEVLPESDPGRKVAYKAYEEFMRRAYLLQDYATNRFGKSF